MDKGILQIIEEEIVNNPSIEEMTTLLSEKGFGDHEIRKALTKYSHKFKTNKAEKKNIRLFTTKEVLDRVGYGFATHQYVNILFYIVTQAAGLGSFGLFIIGIFNGLKSLISVLISSFLQEYQKVKQISKQFISWGGIIFGFSFLFIALGATARSVTVVAIALLIGSIGVVSYGDAYNKLLRETLKKERMGRFLARISQFGVLITAACLLISGWLMQYIPVEGKVITMFGKSVTAYGFLISFEITAFAFIISGYIMSKIHQKKETFQQQGLRVKEYLSKVGQDARKLFKNKIVFLLMLTSMLAGVVQALGNSYYGIFIFREFHDVGLGSFMNVAVIYTIAIVVSLLGPWFTNKLHKSIGFSPMLVFGTVLTAMMPFFAAWRPNLFAIGAANALSIIGAAILGVAQGLLAKKVLREHQRAIYFKLLSLFVTVPFIILVPIGAWIAHAYGLVVLFKILVYTLVGAVAPLYLILVGLANSQKL